MREEKERGRIKERDGTTERKKERDGASGGEESSVPRKNSKSSFV